MIARLIQFGDNSIPVANLEAILILFYETERQGLERRQLPSLPQWYLHACSSTLASNMMCYWKAMLIY